jgi:hypothetical protein
MRIYDRFGYIHEVPDRQSIRVAHPFDQAQVLYDGFGDPVGFAFLAPFLPLVAKAAGALLPTLTSLLTSSPRPAAAPPPSSTPQPVQSPQAMTLPGPLPSAAAPSPQIIVIREPAAAIPPPSIPPSAQIAPMAILRPRRLRRRRAPVRLRVKRVTEQMSVPPPAAVQLRPTSMAAEPSPAEPASPATESGGEMSGWYPVRFGSYF